MNDVTSEGLKKCTFVVAMKEFFGMGGKTLPEFAKELRDIKEDRAFFVEGLKSNGYDVVENPTA